MREVSCTEHARPTSDHKGQLWGRASMSKWTHILSLASNEVISLPQDSHMMLCRGSVSTWRMMGCSALAMRPTTALSEGTSRQPAMRQRPSAATTFSTAMAAAAAASGSCGMNSMPTLYKA